MIGYTSKHKYKEVIILHIMEECFTSNMKIKTIVNFKQFKSMIAYFRIT